MLSVKDEKSTLLKHSEVLTGRETVALADEGGRNLAADIVSGINVPPADNSAMVGYAFRFEDWRDADSSLPLSQRITDCYVPPPMLAGTAARIFTGAVVPPAADTVVMQEHCDGNDDSVTILKRPQQGANIRPRGQDIERGQTVLTAGVRLRPQDLGLVASLGQAHVDVYQPLKVAVLSTGDELVEPGEVAGSGKIYNSNRYTRRAQLEAWGFDVVDLGVARDEPAAVRELLHKASAEADVILTSGGVSVGEEDHVKAVVESLGSLDLWRIAIKPGKPFAFGKVSATPFLGLPGNPVSVFVTMLVIARPFLFASQGIADTGLHAVRQKALFSRKSSFREDYIRVRSTDSGLQPYDNQSSGALFSTSWSDGLVRQPAGEAIEEGVSVDYLPFALFS